MMAQTGDQKPIRGIITDAETNENLVGVHIFARIVHRGSVTDQNGKFEMRVDPEDTIIITFVGYERQIIPLRYFSEPQIDLVIRMDQEIIELPGITITGEQDISYLHRKNQSPYQVHSYKPPSEHPDLDVPAGSLDYGPLSRWGKEAKEKRKLLKIYQQTGRDRVYIQTVGSDSVRQVFVHMYGINEKQYNDFIIFLNTLNPLMDRQDKKDIIRVMHETFLKYKPRRD